MTKKIVLTETQLRNIIKRCIIESNGDGRHFMKALAFQDMADEFGSFNEPEYKPSVKGMKPRDMEGVRKTATAIRRHPNNANMTDAEIQERALGYNCGDKEAFDKLRDEERAYYNETKPSMYAFDNYHHDSGSWGFGKGELGLVGDFSHYDDDNDIYIEDDL